MDLPRATRFLAAAVTALGLLQGVALLAMPTPTDEPLTYASLHASPFEHR
jgi:hypothetical protein